jgi:hypothetical protein
MKRIVFTVLLVAVGVGQASAQDGLPDFFNRIDPHRASGDLSAHVDIW